jgi:hypothetical protein|tara:strand:- start:1468 stop:1875 length:408 start_codon:yes stop_codon:yes gene_type:complete
MYIYVKYFTWCNLINLVDNADVDTAYIVLCTQLFLKHIYKGIIMNKILITSALFISGFALSDFDIKEGYSVSGNISTIRDTAKYSSVEKCQNYANSRSKVIAFTYNAKKRECTLYKSVRSLSEDSNSTSGLLAKN